MSSSAEPAPDFPDDPSQVEATSAANPAEVPTTVESTVSSRAESTPISPEQPSPVEGPSKASLEQAPICDDSTEANFEATTRDFHDDPGTVAAQPRRLGGPLAETVDSDDRETRLSRDGVSHSGRSVPLVHVPGFQVLGVIGRGGMGVVYKARQLSVDRLVALKVLPPTFAADPLRVQRFRNEATVAARLTHSRILPLFDVIESDGAPVLVMQYVDGCDLERILADRRNVLNGKSAEGRHPSSTLTTRGFLDHVLPLLDQAVEAVAVLHEAGVIHRDIKPSNLLVDHRGQVFLSDFGLSRLNEGSGLTLPNQGMGTPGYMAPEQWDGARDVDERADVFGLGATLYTALTLAAPYGTTRVGLDAPPPERPSARVPGLSVDFDAVILKALEPHGDLRYRSAVALRDDWRRVRAGEEPLARPLSRVGRLVRRASRHPTATAALVMILLLTGLLGWFQWRLGIAQQSNPSYPRSVRVRTMPPGARVAVAPLDPLTGDPQLDRPIFPALGQHTPVELSLSPGDYFIEVAWDNDHFEQVFRHVPPRSERIPIAYRHLFWKDVAGVIEFAEIKDRELTGDACRHDMTRFEGSPAFAVPPDPVTGATFAPRQVPAFYLDNTEVTLGEYLKPGRTFKSPAVRVPPQMKKPGLDPREAVRFIDFDCALSYAELRGKRLPTEAEYRFAFTNGGQTTYPNGNHRSADSQTWRVGPVGLDRADRLLSHSDVLGLDSNVAEWTTSRRTSWIPSALVGLGRSRTLNPPAAPVDVVRMRTYLAVGAPPAVVLGKSGTNEPESRPYPVYLLNSATTSEGIGFRCVRSAEPYFLKSATPSAPAP